MKKLDGLGWRKKADLLMAEYVKMSKIKYDYNFIIFDDSDYIMSLYEKINSYEDFKEFFEENFNHKKDWNYLQQKIKDKKDIINILEICFHEMHEDHVKMFNETYKKYFYNGNNIHYTNAIWLYRKISDNESGFKESLNRYNKISDENDFFTNN